MKNQQLSNRNTIPTIPFAAGWNSSLWEDFPEEDMDDEEPPFDAEWGDLAHGDK